jgi:hypothetical protein
MKWISVRAEALDDAGIPELYPPKIFDSNCSTEITIQNSTESAPPRRGRKQIAACYSLLPVHPYR